MTTPQLDLNRRPDVGPWMVDMQRFFEFSFWMAEELIDLEVRFRPVAKPVKLRPRVGRPIPTTGTGQLVDRLFPETSKTPVDRFRQGGLLGNPLPDDTGPLIKVVGLR